MSSALSDRHRPEMTSVAAWLFQFRPIWRGTNVVVVVLLTVFPSASFNDKRNILLVIEGV